MHTKTNHCCFLSISAISERRITVYKAVHVFLLFWYSSAKLSSTLFLMTSFFLSTCTIISPNMREVVIFIMHIVVLTPNNPLIPNLFRLKAYFTTSFIYSKRTRHTYDTWWTTFATCVCVNDFVSCVPFSTNLYINKSQFPW